ncbi:regulator of MON1-CCZ1 complex [Culicoides brevitarsis]|uniref:regulator of MON1-CCZ1 complex n=1 Tax=Culicoides brevitarsis TaxID=469753 RepID=UPI00307B2A55
MYYLELSSKNVVRFDSVSQLTNVFFDDSNKQVFSVRSGGATGITVKSPLNPDQAINFIMEASDRGPIRSIKMSPDPEHKIIAVQRTENSVEFINFINGEPNLADMILHKSKHTIFGFIWIHTREVVLISNAGVELFNVLVEKKQLKSLKTCNLTINWFSWCPASNFALLSSSNGTILTPVLIKQGVITKLPMLELEPGRSVLERDVTLGVLYGISSIFILHQTQSRLVEIVVYTLNGPGLAPKKSYILRLGHQGRFAINIVDDLVIVHHQASKTSLIFDIYLPGETDSVTGVTTHLPLTPGKPIKPFHLKLPSLSYDTSTMECDLYSPNWVLFQPNIVIDAKLGCLWNLEICLEALAQHIGDFVKLTDFLLRRTGAKEIVLSVIRDLVSTQYSGVKLPVIETIFDKLNVIYKQDLDNDLFSQMAISTKNSIFPKNYEPPRVLITQSDMFSSVFSTIADAEHLEYVLIEYIYSLTKQGITIQHDLSKMIIMEMVKNKNLNALHQMLQLSVLSESKPLACFLLSLSKVDEKIFQAAMDMLARLNANEIIIEVLLEKGKVIDALKLAKAQPNPDNIPARKFLEAANKHQDPLVFYSVFVFFQQRNVRLRGNPDFLKNEQCEQYVQRYQAMCNGES